MSEVRIKRYFYFRTADTIRMTVTYPDYKALTVIGTSHKAYAGLLVEFPELQTIGGRKIVKGNC